MLPHISDNRVRIRPIDEDSLIIGIDFPDVRLRNNFFAEFQNVALKYGIRLPISKAANNDTRVELTAHKYSDAVKRGNSFIIDFKKPEVQEWFTKHVFNGSLPSRVSVIDNKQLVLNFPRRSPELVMSSVGMSSALKSSKLLPKPKVLSFRKTTNENYPIAIDFPSEDAASQFKEACKEYTGIELKKGKSRPQCIYLPLEDKDIKSFVRGRKYYLSFERSWHAEWFVAQLGADIVSVDKGKLAIECSPGTSMALSPCLNARGNFKEVSVISSLKVEGNVVSPPQHGASLPILPRRGTYVFSDNQAPGRELQRRGTYVFNGGKIPVQDLATISLLPPLVRQGTYVVADDKRTKGEPRRSHSCRCRSSSGPIILLSPTEIDKPSTRVDRGVVGRKGDWTGISRLTDSTAT